MPRTARASVGGVCYHVMNRGNGHVDVFHSAADYESFVGLIARACERLQMRVLAYCLMPNHFHLLLWPLADGDLGPWMQWLLTSHVRRYHSRYGTRGHIWGGRFKAFPAESDAHLLTLLRYIERNPLRANMVERAEDWQWSSLNWWKAKHGPEFLHPGPLPRPRDWLKLVHQPQTQKELDAIHQSLTRGCPFGSEAWGRRIAKRLGLEASLRPRGRPRKEPKK